MKRSARKVYIIVGGVAATLLLGIISAQALVDFRLSRQSELIKVVCGG
jgi:hypothetical protein